MQIKAPYPGHASDNLVSGGVSAPGSTPGPSRLNVYPPGRGRCPFSHIARVALEATIRSEVDIGELLETAPGRLTPLRQRQQFAWRQVIRSG
jgi:hypothetical protein